MHTGLILRRLFRSLARRPTHPSTHPSGYPIYLFLRLLEGIIDVEGTGPSVPSLVLVDNESGKGTVYDGGAVDDAKVCACETRGGEGRGDERNEYHASLSSSFSMILTRAMIVAEFLYI